MKLVSIVLQSHGVKWYPQHFFIQPISAYTAHIQTRTCDIKRIRINSSDSISVGIDRWLNHICSKAKRHPSRNKLRLSETLAMADLHGWM